jgi:LmbE family N-acetylglucosaminyl deacetylase
LDGTVKAVGHSQGAPQPANDVTLDVLLFDGSPEVAAAGAWLGRADGLRAVGEADAPQALRRLAERQWDLLVVDPATPGALEVVTGARRSSRWTAVLATIVHGGGAEVLQRIVDWRVDGLLFKPLDRAAFVDQALALAGRSRERRLREQKRVLAIGAHPDDVEIACGGTLLRHAAEGDLVKILVLSRGSAGGDVNARLREAREAAELLGASVEFGGLQDAEIPEGGATIALIQRAVKTLRPTHIYTHALEDTHQDHRAAHVATLAAAGDVPNVYCYQAMSTTVDFTPNYYVDISAHLDAKLAALAAYGTMISRGAALHPDAIRATAAYWGRHAGHALSEPLRVMRQHKFSPENASVIPTRAD